MDYPGQPSAFDAVANLGHVLATAIFVFMMVIPSEALAYAQQLSTSHSLTFIVDDALVEEALQSTDFSPRPGARRRASGMRAVDASQVREEATLQVLAFAYSSDANQTDATPFTTANGSRAGEGTIAANWLPLNATVRINDTLYTVQDRMNERYNDRYVIDIWQPSAAAAVQWGVRAVELEIVSLPE